MVSLPFESVGVRRIILNSKSEDLELYYDTVSLIVTNAYTSVYEISFESYYGYPDASLFKLVNNAKNDAHPRVLIDTVPSSPTNANYFTEV